MRITVAERSVRNTVNTAPRLQGMNISTNAAMFGGNTQELDTLAKGLSDVANTGARIVDDIRSTDARDAARQMQKDFMSWQTDTMKKKGKNGMNAAAEYQDWQKSKYETLTKDMDDVTRARFQSIADLQGASYNRWAEQYGFQEKTEYELSTQRAVLTNNADMLAANIMDPELSAQSIEQTIAASRKLAELQGLGEEATSLLEKESVQKALVPAISATIESGNVGAARGMIQQYGEMLGAINTQKLESMATQESKRQAEEYKRIARQQEEQDEINAVESLLGRVSGSSSLEEAQKQGLDIINEEYGEDRELRNRLANALKNELTYRQMVQDSTAVVEFLQYEKDTAGQSHNQKLNYLNNTAISEAGKVLIANHQTTAFETETPQNTGALYNIYTEIDNAIDSRKPLSEQELYAKIAQADLTSKQVKEAIDYYREGGVEGAITQTQLNNALKHVYPDGTSKMSHDMRTFIIQSLPSGRKATQHEINQAAALYAMKGSTEGSGFLTDAETYAKAVEKGRGDLWLPNVEEDEVEFIDTQLQQNGMKINDNNRKLYKRRFLLGLE